MCQNRHFPWLFLFVFAGNVMPLLADAANGVEPEFIDSSPGLGIAAFLIIVTLLLLIGIGIAIGIAICVLTGLLTAFGILSTSTLIGFLRRSPASGFRALFLQTGAVAGIPCGIGAAWLASWLTHAEWNSGALFLIGGAMGFFGGLLIAWVFNAAWGKIGAWAIAWYESKFRNGHRESGKSYES